MFSTKSYTRFVAVVAISMASLSQPAFAAASEQGRANSNAQANWLEMIWSTGGAKWNKIIHGMSGKG